MFKIKLRLCVWFCSYYLFVFCFFVVRFGFVVVIVLKLIVVFFYKNGIVFLELFYRSEV